MISHNNEWQKKLSSKLKESSVYGSNNMGRFIIELSDREGKQVRTIIERKNGKVKKDIGCLSSIVAEFPFSLIPEIAQSKQVKKIWVDSEIKII